MGSDQTLVAILSLATLIAGVAVIIVGLNYRGRMRELQHRERLAMIERGMNPGTDLALEDAVDGPPRRSAPMQRSRSLGIIVVGLGFALMFLISIAGGALDAGIGVGGAVAILGAAFIVRSVYAPSLPAGEPYDERRPFSPPPPPKI